MASAAASSLSVNRAVAAAGVCGGEHRRSLAASPRASLRLSAPLRASPLPLAPSKCRPLRAPLPSRRPTVRAAAAAPAAMADGGLLTRVAVAAYSALVPAGTAASMGLTELTVVLAVRETIIALATAAIFFNAPKICRLVNYVWGTLIMRDDEVTEEEFQDSMFGALVGPLQFVLISLFLTRHLRLLVPLLKLPVTAAMVGKARAVAWVAAATWFATGWKDRVLKLVAASHPEEKPVLANVSKLLTLLLRVAAVGTLAEMMGFSLKSLIAVGGISGVAIGFASKEIVTNFFGGLILFLTQPFVLPAFMQHLAPSNSRKQ
ncbi:unnamed protein product [Closterium sp. Naga37s-1]|nr:unnamed protein product [Closterium sp. Naga37s-1]